MMFGDKRAMSRAAAITVLCLTALALAGCESTRSLNPFAEKDKILPGERRPVFDQTSGFDGPRKLPPPNSDYVGATMRADQVVTPAAQAPAPTPDAVPAPATAPAAKTKQTTAPAAVPPPPPAQ
jgi:hypothetical protein